MDNEKGNMDIWNSMYEVPDKFIKSAKLKGGFSIKAIDAMYQIRTVTEQWGAFGTNWGVCDETIEFIKDIPGSKKVNGKWTDCLKTMAVYKATFFYPGGRFPILSDIEFDDSGDSLKKVKTDALTKGFSFLGISGSVFMGEHDHLGGKYTPPPNDRQSSYNQAPNQAPKQDYVPGADEQYQYDKQEDLGTCDFCGASNKMSQKGKVYCGQKCWLNNKGG